MGLNHSTAPVELRERFAFATEQVPAALRALRETLASAMPEAALLSTCNRTELYVASTQGDPRALVVPAIGWLAAKGGVGGDQLMASGNAPRDRT